MLDTTKPIVTVTLKIAINRLNFESKLLKRAMHSSGSKYISDSCWNEIESNTHDIGIAKIKSGAFSISLSNLLSQAKAMDAIDAVNAKWIIEFFTLKQMIFKSHRQDSTSIGMKQLKSS